MALAAFPEEDLEGLRLVMLAASTRKDFADTALWKPSVLTGEDGRAKVSFHPS